jgi:magnesium-transporting ATPase (P-type)
LENREAAVAAVAASVECDLTLLGATAVEDRLQMGVPESIAALMAAGIRVWVLTGDKLETAISIAVSANLFNPAMPLVVIKVRHLVVNSDSAYLFMFGGFVVKRFRFVPITFAYIVDHNFVSEKQV